MAKRKMGYSSPIADDAPDSLEEHTFFGLKLNPGQTVFRDAIWNSKNKIVFCDAAAGTGKTMIAAAAAVLLVRTGQFDEIVYLQTPINNDKEGFLPGGRAEKGAVFYIPFFQALQRIGVNLNTAIHTEDMINDKNGTAYITCMTDTYIRGMNIGEPGGGKRVIFILDECQQMTRSSLVKNLTRICDGSKAICIGHHAQTDLKNPDDSGFVPMLEHFRGKDWCEICTLTDNYRGDVSRWADKFKG